MVFVFDGKFGRRHSLQAHAEPHAERRKAVVDRAPSEFPLWVPSVFLSPTLVFALSIRVGFCRSFPSFDPSPEKLFLIPLTLSVASQVDLNYSLQCCVSVFYVVTRSFSTRSFRPILFSSTCMLRRTYICNTCCLSLPAPARTCLLVFFFCCRAGAGDRTVSPVSTFLGAVICCFSGRHTYVR